MASIISRRRLLAAGTLGVSGLVLTGCDVFGLNDSEGFLDAIGAANELTYRVQRLLGRDALAPEFSETELSPVFRTNGNTMPASAAYQVFAARGFAGWMLAVDGLVERPRGYTLDELRAMPSRTQITRHDCVEETHPRYRRASQPARFG